MVVIDELLRQASSIFNRHTVNPCHSMGLHLRKLGFKLRDLEL